MRFEEIYYYYYWSCFICLIITLILTCLGEIYKKTFFSERVKLAKKGYIWFAKNRFSYDIIDFFFDSYTWIKNFSLNSLVQVCIAYLILKLTRPLPLIFIILFQLNILLYSYKIILAWYAGGVVVLDLPKLEFGLGVKLSKTLSFFAGLPKMYAFNFIYYLLYLRKGGLGQVGNILLSIVMHLPFWYLKLIIKTSIVINELICAPIWKKKHPLIYPIILYRLTLTNLTYGMVMENLPWFSLSAKRRIVFKERRLRLNPISPNLGIIAREVILGGATTFTDWRVVYFYSRPHQYIQKFGTNHGFMLTKSASVKTKSGPHETFSLIEGGEQNYVYTALEPKIIHPFYKYHNNFIHNNIKTYEQYFGLYIRLSLLENLDRIQYMLVQEKTRREGYYLGQDLSYNQIYCGIIPLKNIIQYTKGLAKINQGLADVGALRCELGALDNNQLCEELTKIDNNLSNQVEMILQPRYTAMLASSETI